MQVIIMLANVGILLCFSPEPHQNEIIPQRMVQYSLCSLRSAKIFGEASDFTPPHPRVTEYGMS